MKQLLPKNVVVIGAGIGGLAVACRLAKDGHKVTLVEKNEQVGGKMNQWESEGFRFDTGPSLFTLPDTLEQTFSYCGEKLLDYLSYESLSPVCRYFWDDQSILDSFSETDKALEEIRKLAPEDEKAYIDFLEYAKKLYDRTTPAFLESPLYEWLDLKSLPLLDAFKIDAFTKMSTRIDKTFKNDKIRQLFKRFATYNGSNPFQAPATLNVIAHVELSLGGYYVHGGMYKIAKALKQLAEKLGVEIKHSTEVLGLNSAANTRQLKSVTTSNGNYSADVFISNCDATITHTKLASDAQINRPKKNQLAAQEASCSGFVLLLGINKSYPQLKHHNIFFGNDYKSEFDDIFVKLRPAEDPTIYVSNTSSKESNDVPNEGYSNLFVLVNAPYLTAKNDQWQTIKEDYSNKIIQLLEKKGLSNLKESIIVKHLITPVDFYEAYLSNKGSIYGTSSNNRMAAFARPKNKSLYFDNLYLCGGSTHPGGGIPLALLSAQHAHTLFNRDHEKEMDHLIKRGVLKKSSSNRGN